MAVRYAVANGKWSATATWDGGSSIPTTGDDVYANSYTVEVDQDIEVAKISTEVCPTTSVGGGQFALVSAYSGDRYITADVVAGTSFCLYPLYPNINLVVIGNVYGGSSNNCYGIYLNNTAYGSAVQFPTIIGNIYGGSGNGAYGVQTRTDRAYGITLTGNVYAGTGASGIRLSNTSSVALDMVGNVYGGATNAINISAYAIGVIKINGIIYGSGVSNAFTITYNGIMILSGGIVNSAGQSAIVQTTNSYLYIDESSPFFWTIDYYNPSSPGQKTLYTTDAFDQPVESDVRKGVEYGLGVYEGTLIVPPVESVARNVPVDDTVGTYELTPEVIEHITELKNPKKVLGSGIIAY